MAAFRFGMAMRGRGYNIFVTGPSVSDGARGGAGGTARIDTLGIVKSLLKQGIADEEADGRSHTNIPPDLCYVHHFSRPDEPSLLRFKAGSAKDFKEDIRLFVENVMGEVPQLFESPEYTVKKNQIIEEHERKTRDLFKKLEARVRNSGFAVINMQVGGVQRPDIAPLIDGEPVVMLKLEELQEKERFPKVELEELRVTYAKLKDEIDAIFLDVRDVQRDVKRKILAMDTAVFQKSARELAHDLLTKYEDKKVQSFVEAMLNHMAEHIEKLKKIASEDAHDARGNTKKKQLHSDEGTIHTITQQETQPQEQKPKTAQDNAFLHVFDVNILVDNSKLTGPPVIVELYPTYRNLFGSIERTLEQSTGQNTGKNIGQSDYRKIHAGSFIKANGGYLVLNLMDAMMEAGVWQTLKRALKNEAMEIQTFDPYYFILTPIIKPEAIEMNVKVVVLATPQLYHLLRHHDDDVARIFKVWADFDASMNRDDAALHHVRQCMQGIVHEADLLPFSASAVATLLELGVRFAGRREKISIAFPQLRDIMEEANYMAMLRDKDATSEVLPKASYGVPHEVFHEVLHEVTAEHVMAAMQARRHRAGQVEEKMQEMIHRGSILIDTKGLAVGQVNGLAVMSMGHHLFGKPSRITATTAIGKAGIINIERESELSGALHTKGILILTGYLNRMFAQKRPLILSASIAFEQSYGGVDGDSASSTEVYALLSSLSGVPIKQGIAVTGSVNQKGEVQAIGGVNEKIEGFYDCCMQGGLTGEQGVLIPHANMQDLMLDVRVVDAVDRGEFHVWSVKNISEGIEILTGVDSGILQNVQTKADVQCGCAEADVQCGCAEDDAQRACSEANTRCHCAEANAECGSNDAAIYAEGSIFAKVDACLDEMVHAFYKSSSFFACKLE
ncbi:MAG: ATP-binding protein [Pseudomonadota bacterium]